MARFRLVIVLHKFTKVYIFLWTLIEFCRTQKNCNFMNTSFTIKEKIESNNFYFRRIHEKNLNKNFHERNIPLVYLHINLLIY